MKKEQARHMYMHESYTQRQIAKELEVSERTVYNWIHGEAWDKLREAAYAAPAIMSQNLCSQLIELQNAIAAREPGQRFPTMQEAVITGKLINGIEKLKKYPSLSQNMQMLETFKHYVHPMATKEFNSRLNGFAELYVEREAKNGFRPFEIEFGIDGAYRPTPVIEDLRESEKNSLTAEVPTQAGKQSKEVNTIAERSFDLTSSEPALSLPKQERPGEATLPQPEKTGNTTEEPTQAENQQTAENTTPQHSLDQELPACQGGDADASASAGVVGLTWSGQPAEATVPPENSAPNPAQQVDNKQINLLPAPEINQKKPENSPAKNFPTRLFALRADNKPGNGTR